MMPIYSECAAYKLKELRTLQNRCVKATYRLERLTSSTYLYSTGLLPINELVKVERAVYVHKLVHSLAKHNFELVTNSSVHSRSTRRDSHIHVFNHRSNSNLANAALETAIDEYNALESEIRHITCFRNFKNRVKLKIMSASNEFSVISPYYFINWPECDIFYYFYFLTTLFIYLFTIQPMTSDIFIIIFFY